MKNIKTIPKEIIVLSFAFFFIFFGFDGVQFFVTTYFKTLGFVNVGFYSLILIYIFYMFANFFAPMIISKIGANFSMIVGAFFYGCYVASLFTHSQLIIYLASILVGIAAALLWTGQSTYFVKMAHQDYRGKLAGVFSTIFALGSGGGILVFGFLIEKFSYAPIFLAATPGAFIGILLLFFLTKCPKTDIESHRSLIKQIYKNFIYLRLSTIWFCLSFVLGLVLGIIPLQTAQLLGTKYVGIFSSLYFLMTIFLSFIFGKLSDKKSREKLIILAFLINGCGLLALTITHQIPLFVIGVLLITASAAILQPTTLAFIADISTATTSEYISSLFGLIGNLGTVIALLIPTLVSGNLIFILSLVVLVVMLAIVSPLLLGDISKLKIIQKK